MSGCLIKTVGLNEDNRKHFRPRGRNCDSIIFFHFWRTTDLVINKKLFYAAAALVLVAVSVFATLKLHWADFHVYYTAGHSLLSGRTDLYAPDFGDSQIMDYRYPLFFLVLFLPFCYLPYQAAEFVWLWLNLAAIFLTLVAVKRGLEITGVKLVRPIATGVLATLICAKYIVVSMRILNAHILVLCLVFWAFYLLLRQRQLAAAVAMALAITFKIVPILTLPYFLIKKQWTFLIATTILIAAFNLSPAVYFGADKNFDMLRDWYDHVMVANDFHNTNGPINVSLEGQLQRYLSPVDYSRRVEDADYQNVNLVALPHGYVNAISKAANVLLLCATVFVIWFFGKKRRRANGFGQTANFDALAFHEFGLIICLTLIVEPRSNVYYFLALFLPLIAFLNSYFVRRSLFDQFAFWAIVVITCALPLLPGREIQRLLLVLGSDFYAVLILCAALGCNIIRESVASKPELTSPRRQ